MISPRTASLSLRIGTTTQGGSERFSLAVQTRAAQLHGLQIVRTFQDVTPSTRAARQELVTLLNVAHQHQRLPDIATALPGAQLLSLPSTRGRTLAVLAM